MTNSGYCSGIYFSTGTNTGRNLVTLPSNLTGTIPSYLISNPKLSLSNLRSQEIELPDGAKLIFDDKGNYRIEDKDAKVTYQANKIREFSPHLNASDLLVQFVKYVGSLGVKQSELLSLPIELFINWLVIEAAGRDKDPIPEDIVRVEQHRVIKMVCKPKCLKCGKYIPLVHWKNKFVFCNVDHGIDFMRKKNPNLKFERPQLPYVG